MVSGHKHWWFCYCLHLSLWCCYHWMPAEWRESQSKTWGTLFEHKVCWATSAQPLLLKLNQVLLKGRRLEGRERHLSPWPHWRKVGTELKLLKLSKYKFEVAKLLAFTECRPCVVLQPTNYSCVITPKPFRSVFAAFNWCCWIGQVNSYVVLLLLFLALMPLTGFFW